MRWFRSVKTPWKPVDLWDEEKLDDKNHSVAGLYMVILEFLYGDNVISYLEFMIKGDSRDPQ